MGMIGEDLSSFVPSCVARRIAEGTPFALPSAQPMPVGVLFADISGFTTLSERLARRGPAGVEQLSDLLNDFFGRLVVLIAEHGGDVVRFAGDALLAVWPATSDREDLATLAARAARCGLAAQTQLNGNVVEGVVAGEGIQLSLRVVIGAGTITIFHVGGVDDRRELLVAGAPLREIGAAEALASPGDVVIAPSAYDLLRPICRGAPLQSKHLRLDAIDVPPLAPAVFPMAATWADEATLRSYVPRAIYLRLAAGQGAWLAEHRRVSVLFVNVLDFDETADDATQQAHAMIWAIQNVARHFEGTLNTLIMDDKGITVVVALGLPPLAHADDPTRAVRMAMSVQHRLHDLGVRCAIGVSTGRAFCGAIGGEIRREYTMIGDVVNVAARLMQAATAVVGETAVAHHAPILCDDTTYQVARSQVAFETLPAISVKGRIERVAVYRPLGEKSATIGPQQEIVGRENERRTLARAIEELVAGATPGPIVVEGEAGIGKTSLIEDARRRADALGVNVVTVSGRPIEQGAAYHGWRAVLGDFLGLASTSDPLERRHAVERVLGREFIDRAPLLDAVLPLDFPENELTASLSGQSRADAIRDLLATIVQAKLAPTPTLLVLEDAHWLDSASWTLALEIVRRLPSVLLVVVVRPTQELATVDYAQVLDMPGAIRIRLDALTSEEALVLVCRRLGVTRLPATVGQLIRDKARGHPFFSEELAYALRDARLIEIDGGECRVAPDVAFQSVAFPDTVQGVITSRIDRLAPQHQLVLKVASVIGEVFAFDILRDIHPIEADRRLLPEYLQTLERLDLTLLDAPEPDLRYAFKHILTREVAYNLMLFAQRRELHRSLAEWYERGAGDDTTTLFPVLAHHWSKAEVVDKAVEYLQKAALHALSIGMPKECLSFGLEAARLLGIDFPGKPAEVAQAIDDEMGAIGRLMGERTPADLVDLPRLADANVAFVIDLTIRIQPAAHIAQQPELFALMAVKNLRLTLQHGNGELAPLVYSMYSSVYRTMTGDSQTAYAFSRAAIDLDERQGYQLTSSVRFIHTWFINHWVNPLKSSLEMCLEAGRLGLERGDVLYGCFNTAGYVVYLSAMGAPLPTVIAAAERHRAIIADRVAIAAFHCLHERQFARALAGQTVDRYSFTDGEFDEERDLASICQTDNYNQAGYYLTSKLRLHYYYRDYAGALGYAARALPLLPAFSGQVAEMDFAFFRALALIARSAEVETVERDDLLRIAKDIRETLRGWSEACQANFAHKWLLVDAELARVEGRNVDAQRLYDAAAESAEQHNYVQHAALARELAGWYCLERGDDLAGRNSLERARALYADWGAQAKVADLDDRLARRSMGNR